MTILRTAFAVLLFPCALGAQSLNHPLVASPGDLPGGPKALQAQADTVKVLAVMVQFQSDTDTRTTGDGRFDTSRVTTANVPIDAPPRNGSFFEDHLKFMRNYFAKVSKGRVIIQTTLIPQVVSLSNTMALYSPAKNGSNKPVADLARDAWQRADSLGLVPVAGPDLGGYRAFFVFHAGVGRDIDLVSSLGYDPAPSDIPSLYLGVDAFQTLQGAPGIPLRGGTLYIPNSIIIPETESRSIPGIVGDVFLEYSISGLMCASFGNYLGLPDLFDTKTGRSAIGRFGLMDGNGFFSFSGAFPPEPSAWEKYWLGWVEPISAPTGTSVLTLPAVALSDTIYKVPIGPGEYYLVENRNRDPQRNGQRVTAVYNGVTTVYSFLHDTTGFNAFDLSLLSGNVVDVEDFDWSLPGGLDNDGTFFDGGILIWHIDESVINRNRLTNTINANPERRGIDVEEADGSQDIGQDFGFLSAGSGSEAGTALDFWYKGNGSPINTNAFTATTHPSTESNDGGVSHIEMRDFSVRGPRMTLEVRVGDNTVTPLPGFPKLTRQRLSANPLTIAPLAQGNMPAILVATRRDTVPAWRAHQQYPALVDARVYAWGRDGLRTLPGGASDGRIARSDISFGTGPAAADVNGDGIQDILLSQDAGSASLFGVSFRGLNADSLADPFFTTPLAGSLTMPVVIADSLMACAGDRGRVYFLRANGALLQTRMVLTDSTAAVAGISRFNAPYLFVATGTDGTVVLLPDPRVPGGLDRRTNVGHPVAGPAAACTFTVNGASVYRLAVTTTDGYIFLLDENLNTLPGFPYRSPGAITAPPALADVNGDNSRDIVAFTGNSIVALNATGSPLDYFPLTIPSADTLVSPPIAADVDGNGTVDIVGVTRSGMVAAYDRTGRPVPGFPLAAGEGAQSAAVFTAADSIFLAVASGNDGSVSGWMTGKSNTARESGNYPWPQFQRDAQHSGLDRTTAPSGTSGISEFFPSSRVYNWPNPAYGGKTSIRYFVKEHATVRIKIYDIAGDLVADLAGPGEGGLDNEVHWDLGGVQSGIYFAHVEASGSGGSGSAMVKIAVVK